MRIVYWLAIAAGTVLAGAPRVIYTKSFPGSVPAYVSIAVDRSGAVEYKETEDDDPEKFEIEEDAAFAIFDLAEKLDHFNRALESGLKVANMGVKTFRWEDGGQATEVKFNYSLDENAKILNDWFDRISDSERVLVEFRRAVRHDRLGVHQALINIQGLWQQKRLTGAQQFLPLLDQVAKNEVYMHMARERAAQLADAIRAVKQKAE